MARSISVRSYALVQSCPLMLHTVPQTSGYYAIEQIRSFFAGHIPTVNAGELLLVAMYVPI